MGESRPRGGHHPAVIFRRQTAAVNARPIGGVCAKGMEPPPVRITRAGASGCWVTVSVRPVLATADPAASGGIVALQET